MEQKDFEALIKGMHSVIELRDLLKDLQGNISENSEDDDDEDCPYIDALMAENKKMAEWAFGKMKKSPEESREYWKKYHKDLPLPRVLKSKKQLSDSVTTLLLLIDIIPLYHTQHNKKGCPCD